MFLKGLCIGCGIQAFLWGIIATVTIQSAQALVYIGAGIIWALVCIALAIYIKKD